MKMWRGVGGRSGGMKKMERREQKRKRKGGKRFEGRDGSDGDSLGPIRSHRLSTAAIAGSTRELYNIK